MNPTQPTDPLSPATGPEPGATPSPSPQPQVPTQQITPQMPSQPQTFTAQPGPQPIGQPQAFGGQVTPSSVPQPPAPQASMPGQYAQTQFTPQPQAMANTYMGQQGHAVGGKKKLLFIAIPIAVVIVAILGVLLLGGGVKELASRVSSIETESYTNTNFSFSMQVPKGWTPEERNEEFLRQVTFQEPVGDVKDQSEANTHYASIRVAYDLADSEFLEKTEQEYFDGIKKGLQSLLSDKNNETSSGTSSYVPEKATIESEESVSVNGLKAYRVKLKVTNFSGEKDKIGYEYGLFVFVDNKNQYEVSIRAHESESINGKAELILDSFTKN